MSNQATIPAYYAKKLQPLVGMTISDLIVVDMGDDDFDRAYGLVLLDSDDNQHVLFPMRDEEGNGPGVLDVERMNG